MKSRELQSLIFPKRGPRAVVLCDGPPPPGDCLAGWLQEADLFVCTDRAGHPYDHLPRPPDVVIGDFDSLSGSLLRGRDGPVYLHVPDQDSSDSEKALRLCIERRIEEAVLLGALGRLMDHSLYNLSLLERFAGELRLCIADEYNTAVRIGPDSAHRWSLPAGVRFSLMPLGGPARRVTLRGAIFPLNEADLAWGDAVSLSNEVAAPPLGIGLGEGALLLSLRHEPPRDPDSPFPR